MLQGSGGGSQNGVEHLVEIYPKPIQIKHQEKVYHKTNKNPWLLGFIGYYLNLFFLTN